MVSPCSAARARGLLLRVQKTMRDTPARVALVRNISAYARVEDDVHRHCRISCGRTTITHDRCCGSSTNMSKPVSRFSRRALSRDGGGEEAPACASSVSAVYAGSFTRDFGRTRSSLSSLPLRATAKAMDLPAAHVARNKRWISSSAMSSASDDDEVEGFTEYTSAERDADERRPLTLSERLVNPEEVVTFRDPSGKVIRGRVVPSAELMIEKANKTLSSGESGGAGAEMKHCVEKGADLDGIQNDHGLLAAVPHESVDDWQELVSKAERGELNDPDDPGLAEKVLELNRLFADEKTSIQTIDEVHDSGSEEAHAASGANEFGFEGDPNETISSSLEEASQMVHEVSFDFSNKKREVHKWKVEDEDELEANDPSYSRFDDTDYMDSETKERAMRHSESPKASSPPTGGTPQRLADAEQFEMEVAADKRKLAVDLASTHGSERIRKLIKRRHHYTERDEANGPSASVGADSAGARLARAAPMKSAAATGTRGKAKAADSHISAPAQSRAAATRRPSLAQLTRLQDVVRKVADQALAQLSSRAVHKTLSILRAEVAGNMRAVTLVWTPGDFMLDIELPSDREAHLELLETFLECELRPRVLKDLCMHMLPKAVPELTFKRAGHGAQQHLVDAIFARIRSEAAKKLLPGLACIVLTNCVGHFFCVECIKYERGKGAYCLICKAECSSGLLAGKGASYNEHVRTMVFEDPIDTLKKALEVAKFAESHRQIFEGVVRNKMRAMKTMLADVRELQARNQALEASAQQARLEMESMKKTIDELLAENRALQAHVQRASVPYVTNSFELEKEEWHALLVFVQSLATV
ncbi:hypothetical protein FVE85_7863 [Porphyridium purpureum]|uniref:Uncharacterized protein n=1 Tax=Porphyridium purpureum TaxID=35688 RepID=A0A5J4YHY1_PORPP|nr:hypothetical protein FVE85_7863 [Porphyridium purpureum]|eukprot:POR1692..scf271_22